MPMPRLTYHPSGMSRATRAAISTRLSGLNSVTAVSGIVVLSAEQFRGLDPHTGQHFWFEDAVPADARDDHVAVGAGLTADFDFSGVQIDDPKLRYAVARIQGALHGAVIVQARVGHLDKQQDIGGLSVGVPIGVGARLQQRKIRLRLTEVVQSYRTLN